MLLRMVSAFHGTQTKTKTKTNDVKTKTRITMRSSSVIKVFLAFVSIVQNVQGYSDFPPLKNYNFNETTESTHIKRILAFGDSLTEGFLSGGRKFYPYTTKLEEKLNSYFNWTRFEVLNEGISGECVFTEMVTRLPKVLARVGNRVNLVIILGGTNDFHRLDCLTRVNVAHEVISLHKLVHKAGLKSVLVTIPECDSLGKKCDKARVKVNEKLRGWALEHKRNTLICDLGRYMPLHNMSMFDRKVFWDDDVHPSKIGYDKIAALLFHTIREELEPPILNSTILFESKAIKMAPKPKRIKSSRQRKHTSHERKDMHKNDASQVTPASAFAPNNSMTPNPASTLFAPSSTAAVNALPAVPVSPPAPVAFNYALPSTNNTNTPNTVPQGTPSTNYTQNYYPSYNGTYDVRPNGTLPTYNTTDAGDLQKELPDFYINQHL